MKITELKLNPKNPRFIKDHEFEKLKQSLKDDIEIMTVKQIKYDETNENLILAGNQRFKALVDLGYKDIPNKWLMKVGHLTEKQKKKLIIIDNVSSGDWDNDLLLEDYTIEELTYYGLDDSMFNYELDDLQTVVTFGESTNFIIKCANVREFKKLQKHLGVNTAKIEYAKFMEIIK